MWSPLTHSAADLVAELDRPVPILACHAHFLADVGRDLLEKSHGELRGLFRQHKVRPGLRSLAREIGRKLGGRIEPVREAVRLWMSRLGGEHALPEGNRVGLGVVRALAQRVLDFPADSTGADFPFDRPYLDLHDRCVQVRRAIDAFLRQPPEDNEVRRALLRLARILDPVSSGASFTGAARTLRERAALFDELRDALHLHPARDEASGKAPGAAEQESRNVRAAVDELVLSLRQRRPQRGPTWSTSHPRLRSPGTCSTRTTPTSSAGISTASPARSPSSMPKDVAGQRKRRLKATTGSHAFRRRPPAGDDCRADRCAARR